MVLYAKVPMTFLEHGITYDMLYLDLKCYAVTLLKYIYLGSD